MINHEAPAEFSDNPAQTGFTQTDPTQSLVMQIAQALVDHPESVEVKALVREESTVLRLHVLESDIGKIIGKQGRTAHSLRTILSAVSMKYHRRYTLDIVESDPPRPHPGAGE